MSIAMYNAVKFIYIFKYSQIKLLEPYEITFIEKRVGIFNPCYMH